MNCAIGLIEAGHRMRNDPPRQQPEGKLHASCPFNSTSLQAAAQCARTMLGAFTLDACPHTRRCQHLRGRVLSDAHACREFTFARVDTSLRPMISCLCGYMRQTVEFPDSHSRYNVGGDRLHSVMFLLVNSSWIQWNVVKRSCLTSLSTIEGKPSTQELSAR